MKKNLLIIGNSAKEYALGKYFSEKFNVYIAPGNSASEEFATLVDIRETNIAELVEFALENDIEFTICASETAIKSDIVKLFEMNNLKIFAPTSKSAEFATNKSVGKKLMYRLNIPTPRFGIFEKKNLALDYLNNCDIPVVIKTDCHISQNGVMICPSKNIAKSYIEDLYFSSEEKIIIEDYIYGSNFTVYFITDGYKILPVTSLRDYKYSLEGDGGILTSGVGSYSPCTKLTEGHLQYLTQEVAYPLIDYLEQNGTPYVGIIGIDGILTPDDRIFILEFNTFFRDYDIQNVLSLIDADFYKLMDSCVIGTFADEYDYIKMNDNCAVSAVLFSGKETNKIISGLDDIQDNVFISHINTKRNEYLEFETTGKNVLVVTSVAKNLSRAKNTLYEELEFIDFEGKKYRKDICSF